VNPRGTLIAALAMEFCGQSALADSADDGVGLDVGVQLGAGRFVGEGADSNRLGPSLTLTLGPRWNDHFAVRALALLQGVVLRTDNDDRPQGSFVALAIAPQLNPFGQKYRFDLGIAPVGGYSFMRGKIGRSATDVEFRSRAGVVGGVLEAMWILREPYAVGISATYLRLFVDSACIRVEGGTTSCDALVGLSPHLVTVQLTFTAGL